MNVDQVMQRDPFVIKDSDTLGTAHAVMSRHGIRHMPVVSDGRLVGMLSEHDLLITRARAADLAWWHIPVRDAMQCAPQTAHANDSLTELAARMAASKIDAFPVVDCGRLLGIVTVIDVLDAEVRVAMR